jgi:arginyl-tRNA synthetase
MPGVLDPIAAFRQEITGRLQGALSEMGCADNPAELEIPPGGMGDYSFPCFQLSQKLHQSPQVVASGLASALDGKIGCAEKIEAKGGYVNFSMSSVRLAEVTLGSVLEHGESYGSTGKKNTRILLEHTSANPTGPLHVGRARNPVIGDTLARIFRRAGFEVATEYYINDVGKQVAMLIWGAINIGEKEAGTPEKDRADYRLVLHYQAANREIEKGGTVVEDKIEDTLLRMERGEPEILAEAEKCTQGIIDGIEKSLHGINIAIDKFARESKFIKNGDVNRLVERLKASPRNREEDGAYYLDMDGFGIHAEDTRFFYTRKDGTTLYTTRDIAYHLDKFKRCDIAINVLGEDQRFAMEQLGATLEILACDRKPHPVYYAFVSLPEGRMSTRKGNVVYLDDIADESVERAYAEVHRRRGSELPEEKLRAIAKAVGIAAIRYNIVRVQAEKAIVFKWEDALNFEGNSAPFIQYSHARACSILRKAAVHSGTGNEKLAPMQHPSPATPDAPRPHLGAELLKKAAGLLLAPAEASLIKKIAEFPSLVSECARQEKAHMMANYAHELAVSFNQFYRDCPVLDEAEDVRTARLLLVDAARITLENSLDCLGLEAPDEM